MHTFLLFWGSQYGHKEGESTRAWGSLDRWFVHSTDRPLVRTPISTNNSRCSNWINYNKSSIKQGSHSNFTHCICILLYCTLTVRYCVCALNNGSDILIADSYFDSTRANSIEIETQTMHIILHTEDYKLSSARQDQKKRNSTHNTNKNGWMGRKESMQT